MPYKSEKIKIEFTKKDKRIKLTDNQKEEIKKDYATGLISHRGFAEKYKVSRKTIYNVLNDDKYKEQLERYKQEQHSKKYYNKEKHKEYIKQHRRYKQNLYLKGEIKKESEER